MSLVEVRSALVPLLHVFSNVRDTGEDETTVVLREALQVAE